MSPELNKKYIKKTMVSERSSWDWTIQKMCRGSGLGVFQPGCVLYTYDRWQGRAMLHMRDILLIIDKMSRI
jgi:hypothetical protein